MFARQRARAFRSACAMSADAPGAAEKQTLAEVASVPLTDMALTRKQRGLARLRQAEFFSGNVSHVRDCYSCRIDRPLNAKGRDISPTIVEMLGFGAHRQREPERSTLRYRGPLSQSLASLGSSEIRGGAQQHPHPRRSRTGGGAVHSIISGQ